MRTNAIETEVPRVIPDAVRVLVVEQDEPLRTWMRWVLESEGFCVDAAANADDAEALPDLASISLIVTDGSQPGVDALRNRLLPEAWLVRVASERDRHLLEHPPERLTFVFRKYAHGSELARTVRELVRLRLVRRGADPQK